MSLFKTENSQLLLLEPLRSVSQQIDASSLVFENFKVSMGSCLKPTYKGVTGAAIGGTIGCVVGGPQGCACGAATGCVGGCCQELCDQGYDYCEKRWKENTFNIIRQMENNNTQSHQSRKRQIIMPSPSISKEANPSISDYPNPSLSDYNSDY